MRKGLGLLGLRPTLGWNLIKNPVQTKSFRRPERDRRRSRSGTAAAPVASLIDH